MQTKSANLRIDNPCPFVPTSSRKIEGGYACKACKKTVIDFRNRTSEEIKCAINKDTCGIFTIDQLPGQQQMKLSKQLFFWGLTLLSLFGFSVNPLQAQTKKNKDSVAVALKPNIIDAYPNTNVRKCLKKPFPETKKKGILRKKKKRRVVGCPSF